MKEEIKEFLRTIPNMYLDDVFNALEEICAERGIETPEFCNESHESDSNDYGCDHSGVEDMINRAINSLESALDEL